MPPCWGWAPGWAFPSWSASVGPPWFDRYITPLALVLVLLSGIGPLIAWRRATAANLKRNFAVPAGIAGATLLALVAAGVSGSIGALLMFTFAAFVVGAVGQELWRGVRARRAMSRDSVPAALIAIVLALVPTFEDISGFSWFFGAGLGAAFYLVLADRTRPFREVDGEPIAVPSMH